MPKKNPQRVNTSYARIYFPNSDIPVGGEPNKAPIPDKEDFRAKDVGQLSPSLPIDSGGLTPSQPWTPLNPPEVGDIIEKTGYLEYIRIDEKNYAGGLDFSFTDPNSIANYQVEITTYCLIGISDKVDKPINLKEYRVKYSNIKGEDLAVSMAVIALLKDAFSNRLKIRAQGILSQHSITLPRMQTGISDQYIVLKSATLLRS